MAEKYGIQTEWDHLPTEKELGNWFVPGVSYLWCLYRNVPRAEETEGWDQIRMRNPQTGKSYSLPRFKISGQDVVVLAKGEPIRGASHTDCQVSLRIDPELEEALGLKPALQALPTKPAQSAGVPEKRAAAGR